MSRALYLSVFSLFAPLFLAGCTMPDNDSSSHRVDDELRRAGILIYQDDSVQIADNATSAEKTEAVITDNHHTAEPEIQISRSEEPQAKKIENVATPDGLEKLSLWSPIDWGIPCKVSLDDASPSGGSGKGLRVQLASTPKKETEAAADKTGVVLLNPKPHGASTKRQISLEVHYSGLRGSMLALAVQVGQSFEYFESKPILLKPGWNRAISFDLNAKNWKSEKTAWRFETQVPTDPVGKLFILVYEPPTDLNILIDSLHFP